MILADECLLIDTVSTAPFIPADMKEELNGATFDFGPLKMVVRIYKKRHWQLYTYLDIISIN
jgi:hypothetical protein